MWTDFVIKLERIRDASGSDIILRLNPQFERLPLPATRIDDPFFPFGKNVIRATRDLVCGYQFDLSSYLALGAAGAVALERTIRFVPRDLITILHGPFTGTAYSPAADATGFGVDALTVTSRADLAHYTQNPPYAAFALDDGNLPQQGGLLAGDHLALIGSGDGQLELRLTDDRILYAGKGENYADTIRQALEEWL